MTDVPYSSAFSDFAGAVTEGARRGHPVPVEAVPYRTILVSAETTMLVPLDSIRISDPTRVYW